MKVHQLYTNNSLRNFTYIIEIQNKQSFVIDPWSESQVNNCLTDNQLILKAIINTHEHWDHTQGNQALVNQHVCEVWAHVVGKGKIPAQTHYLNSGEKIVLDDKTTLEVINTPGHSQAHLCFILLHNNKAQCIFTGDILFNAGVGNCHNGGNVKDLYETIKTKISTLGDEITIYPGHEYLKNNLLFTLDREPNNHNAKKWLEKYDLVDFNVNPLTTTIYDEKQINTFLRLENTEIRENLNLAVKTNKETFIALRKLRDNW